MNEDLLKQTHAKYLELRSLNKVCRWLRETHGVKMTRHQLSPLFHKHGLHVYPPNGKPIRHYTPFEFMDGLNELAADWVQLLWEDVLEYLEGEGVDKIYYMSACAAFNSPLYKAMLGRLNSNVENPFVNENMLPPGISVKDIIVGSQLYERGYEYWVQPTGG